MALPEGALYRYTDFIGLESLDEEHQAAADDPSTCGVRNPYDLQMFP